MPRGDSGRGMPRRPPDYDEGWGRSPAPRRRSAIHDPWSGSRRSGPPGLPGSPVLLGVAVALIFAFLLGRCTAGGGDDKQVATTNTTASATTTTTLALATHTVQENETLAKIASQFGVTIEAIAAVNGITDTNHVFVGQVLKIPPQGAVVVTTTSTTLKKKKN